jgi:hypothetical protein
MNASVGNTSGSAGAHGQDVARSWGGVPARCAKRALFARAGGCQLGVLKEPSSGVCVSAKCAKSAVYHP